MQRDSESEERPYKSTKKQNKILRSRPKKRKFTKIFKIAESWKMFILYFIFHVLYYDSQHIKQKGFEDMSLSIRDYTIIKVV